MTALQKFTVRKVWNCKTAFHSQKEASRRKAKRKKVVQGLQLSVRLKHNQSAHRRYCLARASISLLFVLLCGAIGTRPSGPRSGLVMIVSGTRIEYRCFVCRALTEIGWLTAILALMQL